MDKITLKSGEQIEVTITNWINNQNGVYSSTAVDTDGIEYAVIGRDFDGAIWDKQKSIVL